MRKVVQLFAIRREERWIALAALLFFIGLNALLVCRYYGLFTPLADDYWRLFVRNFQLSGFDPITYYVVSDWEARYNVYRHPLLAFLMYLPYLLNRGLMWLTGINCALFIVAAMLVASAFYSFIFMYRICREVVGVSRFDATLLSALLFSFAFVMLSAMAPDHFILSMCALLLTLYVAGRQIKNRQPMRLWQTIALFVLTAGISLNNGLKVFLADWFVNGKRFFRPMHLVFAVVVPALLMWGFCRFEYKHFVWEHEHARHVAKMKTVKGTAPSAPKKRVAKRAPKQGKPLMNGEFMRWTDITTSRWQSAVENLFGESVQLHQDYLLKDEFRSRPMIVHYRHVYHYVVEALVVLLFLVGIWCGRRSRFLWLVLSFFSMDMLLHMGLGFGINEVYIMSAHWIYAIPIAVGYLFRASPKPALRLLVSGLVTYLYIYNGVLLAQFLF